jgi:hypothetical protein
MKEQFVPYEIALKLKELGFDEECLAHYRYNSNMTKPDLINIGGITPNKSFLDKLKGFENESLVLAPLWQQVIDWFRTNCNRNVIINTVDWETWFFVVNSVVNINRYSNYEEAREQAILKVITLISK